MVIDLLTKLNHMLGGKMFVALIRRLLDALEDAAEKSDTEIDDLIIQAVKDQYGEARD